MGRPRKFTREQLSEEFMLVAEAAKIVYQTDGHDDEAGQQEPRQKKALFRKPAVCRTRPQEGDREAACEGQ